MDAFIVREETDARYWNQIGPHGGWLAARMLAAMRRRHGPEFAVRSLNVDYMGRVERGAFEVRVEPAAAQRTVVFDRATLSQGGAPLLQASAVFARGREAAALQLENPPRIGAPDEHPRLDALETLAAFPRMFDYRVASGWPGRGTADGASAGFLRPRHERRITPEHLAMLADAWFPAAWSGEAEPVPITTVSMSLVFASGPVEVELGPNEYLQAGFRTTQLAGGFGDERGVLWWPDGRLAVRMQQLVWFRTAAAASSSIPAAPSALTLV